jgi:hypothetical protein
MENVMMDLDQIALTHLLCRHATNLSIIKSVQTGHRFFPGSEDRSLERLLYFEQKNREIEELVADRCCILLEGQRVGINANSV